MPGRLSNLGFATSTFKILERLFYARVKPIIDPLLPQQAAFRQRRSAVDQVTFDMGGWL